MYLEHKLIFTEPTGAKKFTKYTLHKPLTKEKEGYELYIMGMTSYI